jgi:hypothetical protein
MLSIVPGSTTRPAAFCYGRGHVVMHGNPALLATFGEAAVGLPAREALVGLPAEAFALMDAVLAAGRPLARWIRRGGAEWRMTVAPRIDPDTAEVYGVTIHLRERSDVPVLRADRASPPAGSPGGVSRAGPCRG